MTALKTRNDLRKMFFLFVFMIAMVLGANDGMAQISMQNLNRVKVDELSDSQIANFIQKYKEQGYTLADVEKMAKTKKMNAGELEKLKKRINEMESSQSSALATENRVEALQEKQSSEASSPANTPINNRIFGSSLFANSKISFEPSQSVATPRNYVIGVNDVLHIDVFGLAEATYDLTVSSQGSVRVPNVGLVSVSGKTIEQVEKILKKKLSSIYSSVNAGSTTVAVSINKIRSIKVFILGEVRNPGTYLLTSVSSVFNAMSACGGPSENGSFRNVKLIRNGKEIATIDLYEFLLNGVMPSDVTLQDQDVIQVPTYQTRVTVNGFVKRDGIYELKSGESLKDLINYCGGFTDDAYTDRIGVSRNQGGEKSVADVTKELFSMFTPASGDVYQVDQILDKYANRVQILGSVFRPGVYALEEGMTLYDLVEKASGITEDAFMESATIVRLQEDLTPEIISFSVKDLMEKTFNDTLRKEDIVTIGGKTDFEPEKQVSIYGAVFSPGVFPYYENITLKDLVFLARGFKEEADPTKIEVVRRIMDKETLSLNETKTEIFSLTMGRDLSGEGADFKLQPRDQVTIRQMEGYESLGVVHILGEIKNPGDYAITKKTEKISDILNRCGGTSRYAYPEGAFLIRKSKRSAAEVERDLKLIEMMNNQEEMQDAQIREEFMKRKDLVGIRLDKIMDDTDEKTNLYLEEGDIIFVPKTLQTVTVGGAVQVPGMEVYGQKGLRKYIRGAGGFTKKARKSGVYVAYSNGEVKSTRRFLWMKNYPDVKPGAHIYVPEKPERNSDDSKSNATFFVSLFSSMATMASVVVSAISVMSK